MIVCYTEIGIQMKPETDFKMASLIVLSWDAILNPFETDQERNIADLYILSQAQQNTMFLYKSTKTLYIH